MAALQTAQCFVLVLYAKTLPVWSPVKEPIPVTNAKFDMTHVAFLWLNTGIFGQVPFQKIKLQDSQETRCGERPSLVISYFNNAKLQNYSGKHWYS